MLHAQDIHTKTAATGRFNKILLRISFTLQRLHLTMPEDPEQWLAIMIRLMEHDAGLCKGQIIHILHPPFKPYLTGCLSSLDTGTGVNLSM